MNNNNVNYLKWLEIAPGLPGVAESIYNKYSDVCPPVELVFRALELVGPDEVRVCILGQDPYPTPGKASGLAFGYHPEYTGSVDSSLANILTEVESCGYAKPSTSLLEWARQGVLLLNTRLTVEAHKPMSHAGLGWEEQIEKILKFLTERTDTIFMLWGREAQLVADRAGVINRVMETSHPCKFSANRGFIGSKCFLTVNTMLHILGKTSIKWG